jgi:hypothetical protein
MSFVEQPKLSTWGIEEIEANTCEDNALHRRILNNNKIPFRIFEPGVIEVLFENYDELNAHHESVYERKKIILSNPKNPWSDYLPFEDLPLDFLETAPAWIQRHLNKYNDAVADGTPENKLPILPKRCRRKRADGSRCWNWSWPAASAEGFCKGHSKFGAFNVMDQMNRLNDAAKVRLGQMSPEAVAVLEDLMMNSDVPHVRLKAATEVLDRIGIRGGTELTVSGHVTHEVEDPAQVVRDRLSQLAERAEAAQIPSAQADQPGNSPLELPVVQGEVVESETNE